MIPSLDLIETTPNVVLNHAYCDWVFPEFSNTNHSVQNTRTILNDLIIHVMAFHRLDDVLVPILSIDEPRVVPMFVVREKSLGNQAVQREG